MQYRSRGIIYRPVKGDLVIEHTDLVVEAIPKVDEPTTVFDGNRKRTPKVAFKCLLPDGRRLTFSMSTVDLACALMEAEAELRGQMFVKGLGMVKPALVIPVKRKMIAQRKL